MAKYCHFALENTAAKRVVVNFHWKPAMHRQWLVKCGRLPRRDKQARVCSLHFARKGSKFLSISGRFVKQLLLKPDAVPSIFGWTQLSSVDEVALTSTATRSVWEEPRSRWMWSHQSHFISPHMFSRSIMLEHIHTVMPTWIHCSVRFCGMLSQVMWMNRGSVNVCNNSAGQGRF